MVMAMDNNIFMLINFFVYSVADQEVVQGVNSTPPPMKMK